jgi:hypothetical protein
MTEDQSESSLLWSSETRRVRTANSVGVQWHPLREVTLSSRGLNIDYSD